MQGGLEHSSSMRSGAIKKVFENEAELLKKRRGSDSSVASNLSSVLHDSHDLSVARTPSPTFSESGVVQHAKDLVHADSSGPVTKMMLRVLGKNFTRRVSNLFKCMGIGSFLEAVRTYMILGPEVFVRKTDGARLQVDGQDINMAQLAARFKPKIFTINAERLNDPDLKPTDIRYEVLPPKDSDCLSIIYYIKAEDEHMPIPIIGKLYGLVRPVLWGSKPDWEAVVVDVNRNTGEAEKLTYETCNLTANPASYYALSPRDLHLKCEVEKQNDGSWMHSLKHKGKLKTKTVEDPFLESNNVGMAYISWNGGFELGSVCEQLGYGEGDRLLEQTEEAPLNFLSSKKYGEGGFDLKVGWANYLKNKGVKIALGRKES